MKRVIPAPESHTAAPRFRTDRSTPSKPNLKKPAREDRIDRGGLQEGFSIFNNDLLDEYSDKNDEFRDVTEGFAHWYDIKRATMRALRKFFGFILPDGTRMHKIMTSLEGKAQVNKMTNESEKAPLVQTGARDFVGGGFDVVINCCKEESKDGHEEFFYRCAGASSKYAVKNRDFALKPVEKADPERIWKVLKGVA